MTHLLWTVRKNITHEHHASHLQVYDLKLQMSENRTIRKVILLYCPVLKKRPHFVAAVYYEELLYFLSRFCTHCISNDHSWHKIAIFIVFDLCIKQSLRHY